MAVRKGTVQFYRFTVQVHSFQGTFTSHHRYSTGHVNIQDDAGTCKLHEVDHLVRVPPHPRHVEEALKRVATRKNKVIF